MPPEAADGVAVVEIDVGAGGVTPSDPPWVDWVAGGCLAECYAEDEVVPNVGPSRGSHVVGLLAELVVLLVHVLFAYVRARVVVRVPFEEAEEEDGGEGGAAQVFAAVCGVDGQVVVVVVVVAVVAPMDG